MITAILCAGKLRGKMKIGVVQPEITIVMPLPLSVTFKDTAYEKNSTYPRMVFEWRRQTGKFTHEYTLKTIV